MATQVIADRVRESNVITGTGAVTLGGSLTGYQTFASVMANGSTTWYSLVDNIAGAWEIGLGTWNTGNTLSRTTVLSSSNSGSLVSFAGNSCDCFGTIPAAAAGQPLALKASAITANAQLSSQSLPINAVVLYAIIRETAGHVVSVALGTTSGGSDVMSAVSVPASGVAMVTALSFAKLWFSASAAQAVYVTSASWGSASVNIELVYQAGP
jgi:hypothetical protein